MKQSFQKKAAVSKKNSAPPSNATAQTEWLHLIATIAPVGIYRTDANGRYVWVNAKWIEMTGYSFEDAQGFEWKKLIHPADRHRVAGEWAKVIDGSKPFQLEYRHLRLDGSVLWIYSRMAEAKDRDGRVVGYIGVSTDITALHQLPDGSGNGSNGNGADSTLTLREKEVVRHIAGGDSNKCAAERLGLSVRTVESHRARIMRKLQITSLPDLVRYAVRSGLVSG